MTGRRLLDRVVLQGDSPVVAPRLLGTILERPEEGTAVRIIEVEAYDEDDPASHTFRGRTARNAVMFGPAGHAYVYFTYGMHWCMNVVTGPDGHGQAVLLRAAEVVDGEAVLRARRGDRVRDRDLLRGPARLASALGIDGALGGVDLLDPTSPVQLAEDGFGVPTVATGPRVGVRLAADRPWRFWIEGHPQVSRYVRHRRADESDGTRPGA
ncbi:DNA-3-methyladenine glycosylase [Euzebya pacifica]|jgi:DNA-3-methyladenine glycosylase|uniref:DNA-3-methyladenine glycosylase n=1 Tax=Euzebya pacifica TaxID=1608957 RepID=UPI003C6D7EA6